MWKILIDPSHMLHINGVTILFSHLQESPKCVDHMVQIYRRSKKCVPIHVGSRQALDGWMCHHFHFSSKSDSNSQTAFKETAINVGGDGDRHHYQTVPRKNIPLAFKTAHKKKIIVTSPEHWPVQLVSTIIDAYRQQRYYCGEYQLDALLIFVQFGYVSEWIEL